MLSIKVKFNILDQLQNVLFLHKQYDNNLIDPIYGFVIMFCDSFNVIRFSQYTSVIQKVLPPPS